MNISQLDALSFLNQFIFQVKKQSKHKDIKISGRELFSCKILSRGLEEPKDKESYIIMPRKT